MALYEQDFFQWPQEQAALLKAGALSQLDVANLIEEDDVNDLQPVMDFRRSAGNPLAPGFGDHLDETPQDGTSATRYRGISRISENLQPETSASLGSCPVRR